MLGGTHVLIYSDNIAVFIDQEGGSQYAFVFLTHELLGTPHTIQVANLVSLIREQWKLQLKFLLKFDMGFYAIWANT